MDNNVTNINLGTYYQGDEETIEELAERIEKDAIQILKEVDRRG